MAYENGKVEILSRTEREVEISDETAVLEKLALCKFTLSYEKSFQKSNSANIIFLLFYESNVIFSCKIALAQLFID